MSVLVANFFICLFSISRVQWDKKADSLTTLSDQSPQPTQVVLPQDRSFNSECEKVTLLLHLLMWTNKSWRYHVNISPCDSHKSIVGCEKTKNLLLNIYHAKLWWNTRQLLRLQCYIPHALFASWPHTTYYIFHIAHVTTMP